MEKISIDPIISKRICIRSMFFYATAEDWQCLMFCCSYY